MFCGYCGRENADDYSYCTDCGEPLEELENSHSINEAPSEPKRSDHENVRWLDNTSRWEAFVQRGEKETILGQYEDEEAAAVEANDYIKKLEEQSRDTEHLSKQNEEQRELKNLNIFTNKIERLLNQTLTEQAKTASEDFLEFHETIHHQLGKGVIKIVVDPLLLNRSHPQYGKKYYARRGMGIVIFIIGFILLFKSLVLGAGIIVLGLIVMSTAKNMGKIFINDLKEDMRGLGSQNAMAYIAANYITGVIQLKGPKGSAHWPQYPSSVFTGSNRFINADIDTRGKLSGKLGNHNGIRSSESSMGAVKQLSLIALVCLLAFSNIQLIVTGDVFDISPFLIPFKLIENMFSALGGIFTWVFG